MKRKPARTEQHEARNAGAQFQAAGRNGAGSAPAADESDELQRLKLTVAELTLQLERLRSRSSQEAEPDPPWQPRRSMA